MAKTEVEELVETFTRPEILQVVVDTLERPLARLVSQLEGKRGHERVFDIEAVLDDTVKELMKKLWP